MRTLTLLALVALTATMLAGCSGGGNDGGSTGSNGGSTGGTQEQNPYDPPSSSTQVAGSGATFPKPLLESWGIQYNREESKVQVSYAGGGSGKGITDITKKDVLFAGSDAPMSASEKAAAPGILQFPETLGLVAVAYNVNSIADGLKLDGETVGKIYAGDIKKWNDPAIAALNPGMSLPNSDIAIVYRSDSSGTTFVFTDFLGKTSTAWASKMGAAASKKPDWTKSAATQLSGNGNDGVGTTIKGTPNSIGYVELAYVHSLDLKAAKMKSHDGEFLEPTTEGASKAAAAAVPTLPAPSGDWSKVSIVDAAGPGAYPISSFSYMLVYDSLSAYGGKVSSSQMQAFKAWMWWGLHDGQVYAEALGYAPLPAEVVAIGDSALASIR
jgi:phosphate transport system substrate-binding protein